MRKKLFLAYIYGPRNAGDMALNYGALDLLNSVGEFEIVGLSRFSAEDEGFLYSKRRLETTYPNLQMIPYPVSYDRHRAGVCCQLLSHARGASMYLRSVIKRAGGGGDELDVAIGCSDHVLFNGGNALFSRGLRDVPRLGGVLYPLYRARVLGKPIAFLPQSIAAASGLGGRWIQRYLDGAWFVAFRESISCQGIHVKSTRPLCALDLAFLMEGMDNDGAEAILAHHKLKPHQFVPVLPRGMTLGDQRDLPQREYAATIRLTVELCKEIIDTGLSPVFVLHVKTDLKVIGDCRAALGAEGYDVGVVEEYDPLKLRALYAWARAVYTMRLHAAIFALSVGTIAVGFHRSIWGPKMPGIFSDLGIKDLCFGLDTASSINPICLGRMSCDDRALPYRQVFLERIRAKKDELVSRLKQGLQ